MEVVAGSLVALSGCTVGENQSGKTPTSAEGDTTSAGPQSGRQSSIRILPRSTTIVFDGEISADEFPEELSVSSGSDSLIYREDGESGVHTYLVYRYRDTATDLDQVRTTFEENTEFDIERVYYGVGPETEAEFVSWIGQLAEEHSDVAATAIKHSTSVSDDQQEMAFTAGSSLDQITPLVSEIQIRRITSYRREGKSETEPLLDESHIAVDRGFEFTNSRSGHQSIAFYLDSDGARTLSEAIEQAENVESEPFLQLAAGDTVLNTYRVQPSFAEKIRNGSWDRQLELTVRGDDLNTVFNETPPPRVSFSYGIEQ